MLSMLPVPCFIYSVNLKKGMYHNKTDIGTSFLQGFCCQSCGAFFSVEAHLFLGGGLSIACFSPSLSKVGLYLLLLVLYDLC